MRATSVRRISRTLAGLSACPVFAPPLRMATMILARSSGGTLGSALKIDRMAVCVVASILPSPSFSLTPEL
jgi:hypothetical protein